MADFAELCLNEDFELVVGDDFDDWIETENGTGTVEDEAVEVHGGSHSAKLSGDGTENNWGRVTQAIAVDVGKTYRISLWVKGDYSYGIWFNDIQGEAVQGSAAAWEQKIHYYTAEHTPFKFYLVSSITKGAAATAYYDDVSLSVYFLGRIVIV